MRTVLVSTKPQRGAFVATKGISNRRASSSTHKVRSPSGDADRDVRQNRMLGRPVVLCHPLHLVGGSLPPPPQQDQRRPSWEALLSYVLRTTTTSTSNQSVWLNGLPSAIEKVASQRCSRLPHFLGSNSEIANKSHAHPST